MNYTWLLQNIVFCQLCLTDQLFPLAFQLLKIIDLLLIHISPYFPQPCVTVVLITIVLITRMENRISSAVAIRHNFVPWNECYVIFIQPQVIRTPSYFLTLWLTGFKLKLFEYLYLAKFYKVWYGLEDKYDQSKLIITN